MLIVNPSAGGGRATRLLPAVRDALTGAGVSLRVERTRDLDHADDLVAEAATEGCAVLALGGDGLAGRVAGAAAAHQLAFAALPGGRGNDFVRAQGLGRDPAALAASLVGGGERRIDLAEVDGRSYLGIASVGFDSDVQRIAAATRLPLGQAVYFYAALRALGNWRAASFTMSCDGERSELTGYAVAVANSGVYGGGMRLAPDASLDDGALDVVTTAACSKGHFLATLPRVFAGTHVRDRVVSVRRAGEVRLAADREFTVYADGDPIGELPVTIRVRPGVLRLLTPG